MIDSRSPRPSRPQIFNVQRNLGACTSSACWKSQSSDNLSFPKRPLATSAEGRVPDHHRGSGLHSRKLRRGNAHSFTADIDDTPQHINTVNTTGSRNLLRPRLSLQPTRPNLSLFRISSLRSKNSELILMASSGLRFPPSAHRNRRDGLHQVGFPGPNLCWRILHPLRRALSSHVRSPERYHHQFPSFSWQTFSPGE